jgi:hypothetical protein
MTTTPETPAEPEVMPEEEDPHGGHGPAPDDTPATGDGMEQPA